MSVKKAAKLAIWLCLAFAALFMASSLGMLLELWYLGCVIVPVDTDVWLVPLGLPIRPYTLRTRDKGWIGVCAQVQAPSGRTTSACLWRNAPTAAEKENFGGLRDRLARARAQFRPGESWQFVGVTRKWILLGLMEGCEFESEKASQSQRRRIWLAEKALPEALLQIVAVSGGR